MSCARVFTCSLLLSCFGFSLASATSPGPFVPADDRVLQLFREEIAPLYRPSGGEEPMRALVRRKVEAARVNEGWAHGEISIDQDEVGNQMVMLPGTGRFRDAKIRVLVQGHHDMVTNVAGTAPASIALARGVDLVQTGDIIHTRDHKSTAGFDNGIGAAQMMTLIEDPSIEHPPLGLLFTVEEERTMVGAFNLGFDLSPFDCLINVDSEESGTFAYGCLGGRRLRPSSRVEIETIPLGAVTVIVDVRGFPGGHSGVDIHKPSANAATFSAEIVGHLVADFDDVRLAEWRVADRHSLNSIPASAMMRFTAPPDVAEQVVARARHIFDVQQGRTVGAASGALTARVSAERPTTALTRTAAIRFARLVSRVRNGVLTRQPDLPNGVNASSNIGFVAATPGGWVSVGAMIRAYDQRPIDVIADQFKRDVRRNWPSLAHPPLIRLIGNSPPMLEDPTSWFFEAARRADPNVQMVLVPGGLEPAVIKRFLRPGVPVGALGATIMGPHSTEESLVVSTVPEAMRFLRNLLIEVTTCDRFLAPQSPSIPE